MLIEPVPPSLEGISVVAASTPLDARSVDIVVTVPTFRRPELLLRTLESVRAQTIGARVATIVIENDAAGQDGARAAAPLFSAGAMGGLVIVAHERGNCAAYNAGWGTALARFPSFGHLAVIDDDEAADPDWLKAMRGTAAATGADIVGGPQVPVFPDAADAYWAEHPVFAPPYGASGVVSALYSSGNLLIARRVLETMEQPFLDLRFNFMGGGDSDFLSRAHRRGFRLAWCAEGMVREDVPARRLEADWIRKRSLRNGVISTLVEKKKRGANPAGHAVVAAHSLALLAAAPLRAAWRLARTGSPSRAAYPLYVAAGRVMAEFGYANEQYRQPEKN